MESRSPLDSRGSPLPRQTDPPSSSPQRRQLSLAPVTPRHAPPVIESADYSIRVLDPLAKYFRDKHGKEVFEEILAPTGLGIADFDQHNRWISSATFEKFLEVARERFSDDASFKQACTHRLEEGYGPVRYVLWATSPAAVYLLIAKTYHLVARIGRAEVVSYTRTSLHLRMTSDQPFSRCVCLVRQAHTAALPTMWGLPPASLREENCIAHGDSSCDFHFTWFDTRRWLPVLLGTLVGSAAISFFPAHTYPYLLPIVGALLGYTYELTRTDRTNLHRHREMMDALAELARDESEAQREMMAYHQRQREWTRLLEEEAHERATTLAAVTKRIEELQQARETTLLGFSHDLRNPLLVIKSSVEYLRDAQLGDEEADAVRDLDMATQQMQRMLSELMEVATTQRNFMQLLPQRFQVEPLTERLRRRLRALVHGRDIRPTVFSTREAPDSIEVDPLLFDRVTDNLLTNAAKYTERGSIVVEVDGSPGFLVIKVSDTGRGIPDEELEKIFHAGGSDTSSRARDSYGVGLSVVVNLLDHIGGKLEVMSKPGRGTTFWIHFPVSAQVTTIPAERSAEKNDSEVLSRVVRIRKQPP